MLLLVRDPIDVNFIRQNCGDDGCGGVVIFEGRVRNSHQGKTVKALEYEAYPELARKVFKELADVAQKRWKVSCVDIVHRVGTLQVGEVAVVVAVAASHRREAFEACQFVLEELKRKAPIWKKEYYEDGVSHWVGNAWNNEEAADGSVAGRRAK